MNRIRRSHDDMEELKTEIYAKGSSMSKAWNELYVVLRKFEAKLLAKEGELAIKESNMKGREEAVISVEVSSGKKSDLRKEMEKKDNELKESRRENKVQETVLSDQYKLIQQERMEKTELERRLEQLNFDLKRKDQLLSDLQKKLVNNSVSLSREISEMKIRMSVERQANETRKRKVSSSSAVSCDNPTEAKSPRVEVSASERWRELSRPLTQHSPSPTSVIKTEQNEVGIPDKCGQQTCDDELTKHSHSDLSSQFQQKWHSVAARQPEQHSTAVSDQQVQYQHPYVSGSLSKQRPCSTVSSLPEQGRAAPVKVETKREEDEEDDDDDVVIISSPQFTSWPATPKPVFSKVKLSSGGAPVQNLSSENDVRSDVRQDCPSRVSTNSPSTSSYISQIAKESPSADQLLARIRMVQANFGHGREDRVGLFSSVTSDSTAGCNPWQEMLDETSAPRDKENSSTSSDQDHLDRYNSVAVKKENESRPQSKTPDSRKSTASPDQCIYCKFCDVGFWDTGSFAEHLVNCSEMRSGLAGKQIRGMVVKDPQSQTVQRVNVP